MVRELNQMSQQRSWLIDGQAALDMKAAGKSTSEIAAALGRTSDSVRSYLGERRRGGKEKPATPIEQPPVAEVKAIEDSAAMSKIRRLEQQLADLATAQSPKRVHVECDAVPPVSPAEMWQRAEEEAERAIAHVRARSKFKVEFPDDEIIGISFVSDQHISVGAPIELKRMREDAELIDATDGLYAVYGGDGVDNHCMIRPAMLNSKSTPKVEWILYDHLLSIAAEKIIAMISGNHDLWSEKMAGIDMVSYLAAKNKLHYSPHEARILVKVGQVTYKLAIRHKYRFNSSLNQTHSHKQWWRNGEADFDVGVLCHLHEPAMEPFNGHGLRRWALRPGSYQVTSSYTEQEGFNMTWPTCPTVLLFGKSREIIGFEDVRQAAKVLTALRGKKS